MRSATCLTRLSCRHLEHEGEKGMRHSRILKLVGVLIGVIVLAASGIAVAQSDTTVTMGLTAEPPTLEPAVNSGTAQRAVKLSVYRGLFNYGPSGEPVAELAQSFTISGDRKTYTIKLRNAKFHNGDPVTSEDVVFTFERILDPKTGATFSRQFGVLDSVKVVDASTVQFVLKQPTAPFIDYLALPESVIVSKKWIQVQGDNVSRHPMGAGPFRFIRWDRGQRIVLEAFSGYYKPGLPKTRRVVFQFYPDDTARVNALRAGDVDLIEYVPWKDIATLKNDPRTTLYPGTGPFMGIIFNTTYKPFSDPRVRQAFAYAIDRKAILNTAFSGQGRPMYGMPLVPGNIGYSKALDSFFKYDPRKAKELLAEAGYANGLKARLLATSQYAFHQQTAVAIAAELKKIGVTVDLDLPDWATRLDKNLKADYDFLVVGTAGDITDPDFLSDYYASGPIRLNSAPGFSDPDMDRLLQQARETTDRGERTKYYNELQQRALKLSPLVFLTWREQAYASSSKIKGFVNLPGFLSFQSGLMLEQVSKEQ